MLHHSIQVLNTRIHELNKEIAELQKDKAPNVYHVNTPAADTPAAKVKHVKAAPEPAANTYDFGYDTRPMFIHGAVIK